ncbi:glycosyltransferase family 2 protein [Empedobacter falsenii]
MEERKNIESMGASFKEMISVIIPVYNTEEFVVSCIDSVLAQSYTNFELIIIDDGSSDDSYEILKKYDDKRIKLIQQENKGVSATRNRGIDLAKGDYICFIDSDDYIDKNYLENFVKKIYNKENLLIQDIQRFGKRKANYISDKFYLSNNMREIIVFNRLFANGGPVAKFYSTEIIHKNDIRFKLETSYGEDLIFFLEYLKYVKSITYLDVSGYNYNYNNTSASTKRHSFQTYIDVNNSISEFVKFYHIIDSELLRISYEYRWDFIQSTIDKSIEVTKENFDYLSDLMEINFLKFANSNYRRLLYVLLKFKIYKLIIYYRKKII